MKNKSARQALKYHKHHVGDDRCLACDNFNEKNEKRTCGLIYNAEGLGSCLAWQRTSGIER